MFAVANAVGAEFEFRVVRVLTLGCYRIMWTKDATVCSRQRLVCDKSRSGFEHIALKTPWLGYYYSLIHSMREIRSVEETCSVMAAQACTLVT
jgi:hypothetical protein